MVGRQPGANLDSAPIRVSGGLKGLFSRRLALTLEGDFMQSNHEVGESYSGPTALVEADYRIPGRLRFRLAYELRIGGDGFSNFFYTSSDIAKAELTLPMRLFLELGGGFDYYIYSRYGAPEWTYTLPERIEPMIRASAKLGWKVRQWLRTFLSTRSNQMRVSFITASIRPIVFRTHQLTSRNFSEASFRSA